MASKRNRRRRKAARNNPYGPAGQANGASAAANAPTAAHAPDSPSGASSPAEPNPYGQDAQQESGPGLETPDDVRRAGLSPDLPFEAPDPGGTIRYSDGKTFFEKFPELLNPSE